MLSVKKKQKNTHTHTQKDHNKFRKALAHPPHSLMPSSSLLSLSCHFSFPPHHVGPISHGEAEKERETEAGERKVCFSGEDNIPRPISFLSLLIDRACTQTHTHTTQTQGFRANIVVVIVTVENTSSVSSCRAANTKSYNYPTTRQREENASDGKASFEIVSTEPPIASISHISNVAHKQLTHVCGVAATEV